MQKRQQQTQLKISYLLILSITILFLTFAIHSYFTYDFTLNEATKTTLLRNQAQANDIVTDLDRHIHDKLADFQELTKLIRIQTVAQNSNEQFDQESINKIMQTTIRISNASIQTDPVVAEILGNEPSALLREILGNSASALLRDTVRNYKSEYDYDVINELFVTNQYGVIVALGAGNVDYVQTDKDWWEITKNKQNYIGDLEYDENSDMYLLPIGYPILDDSSNYVGTVYLSLNLRFMLQDFIDDADILTAAKKTIILLDKNGKPIYENGEFFPIDNSKEYFSKLDSENGSFEYLLASPSFISYAKSIGYRNFEGFDWVVVLEQESAVVDEFEDLEKNFLFSTIIGIVAASLLGITLSYFVTNPLKKLASFTTQLGKGDFSVKAKKGRIGEINSIVDSFNEMEISLKKLFDTEKDLAEANARIKNERLAAIGELAASMAHDMKNPLGTIRSGMDIIRRQGDTDQTIGEVIQRMDRAVSRMAHQVEDVLNFVRVTPLSLKVTSLNNIIKSAMVSLEIPKMIQVNMEGDDITVTCDEKKLEIVFINLILNSIQSIGDVKGRISIRTKTIDGSVVIQIEDSGPGIPEEIIPDIFKPLVTTKQKGTGLGLASCKNIVKQHGGTIKFQNNPTVFTVTLPLQVK
jgi:signal transduction histidine kinase